MKKYLSLAVCLLFAGMLCAQNYEQQGDELYAQSQYEKAVKKYTAAIEFGGNSNSINQKISTAKQCQSILNQALQAEQISDWSKAAALYGRLYNLHPLASYKSKADNYKQKAIARHRQEEQKRQEAARLEQERQEQARKQAEQERLLKALNGHEAVDLGLPVLWASVNVGANKPEEYGDYFAWGETSTKAAYMWGTYKHCKGGYDKMTKYCIKSKYGVVDNKKVLDKSDDAASIAFGGSWRMPTDQDWNELKDNCTFEWVSINGTEGYLIKSKINSNSIFLPAAGYMGGTEICNIGVVCGSYWSTTLDDIESDMAGRYYLSTSTSGISKDRAYRYYGLSVRPVIEDGNYVSRRQALMDKKTETPQSMNVQSTTNDIKTFEIRDVVISDISPSGYNISCKVLCGEEIDRVQFPTWTVENGQDDLVKDWQHSYNAKGWKSGNIYKFRVNISEHNNEKGDYITHIYAYTKSGKQVAINAGVTHIP